MTRIPILPASALATGLTGCSAATTDPVGAAPVSEPVAATTKADAPPAAVQGYSEALLTGDVASLPPYLHPNGAGPQDQRNVMARALDAPKPAKGGIKVETVEMRGTAAGSAPGGSRPTRPPSSRAG